MSRMSALVSVLSLAASLTTTAWSASTSPKPSDVKIGGYLGQRIPLNVINAPYVPYNPPAN